MTRYLVSIYQPDTDPPPPEVLDPIMADVAAVNEELRASGSWVFAAGLHPPSTATTLRVKDGEVLMTDGPFTEGKEHLGGFSVIESPDLDAALAWASKTAVALRMLSVEVRPMIDEADRSCGPGPGA
jgi:hypothetical protein